MRTVQLKSFPLASIAWMLLIGAFAYGQSSDAPTNIGSRRELFVDDLLIDSLKDEARRKLHQPVRREIAIVHDAPWEGNGGNYHTVFYDPDYRGGIYRMYYHAWQIAVDKIPGHALTISYCESKDGVHWVKPKLGLFEFEGSKENNIVLATINGQECHDLSVFKDENPQAAGDAKYKAVGLGREPRGLYAFKSPDGLHWSLYNESKPVMTGHPFDTQNLAFWDPTIGKYRAYVREFDEDRRDIMTATSADFIHWTEREWLKYTNAPHEALYTNQVKPYYRAPHILIGFPSRYVDRGWLDATRALPSLSERMQRGKMSKRYGTVVTDALLMSSRDGRTFRRASEAFLRPGLRTRHNWAYGDNYIAWHVVETDSVDDDSPRELSLYATESYFTGKMFRLRRYTLRIDGFASINAPLRGGELLTKTLVFRGATLSVNCSTSAAGSLRVEIQDATGEPVPGFALRDCDMMFGDSLDYRVRWQGKADLSELSGKPVRLRFVLHDADLYSLRFLPSLPRTTAALSKSEDVKVVCFGDSVTGVYYHTGSRRAYTKMVELGLGAAFPEARVTAINAGISGHTTSDALKRIERDVLKHRPQLVTVMFGLNDLVRIPLDDFRANLIEIVDRCRAVGAEVLLCTPNTVLADTPGRARDKLVRYCEAIHQVGKQIKAPVCDCYEAFEKVRQRDALAWRMLMSDEFHPNMDGHKLIASEITHSIIGRRLELGDIEPPQPAIPRTLSLLRETQPIRILAMPPYDRLIEPALKEVAPKAQVEVESWPTEARDLVQISEDAKRVRAKKIDLVVLAVPSTAKAESLEEFIHAYSWTMNRSLSFSHQEWDVVVVSPRVADPQNSIAKTNPHRLVRQLVGAQDLSLIDRSAGDTSGAENLLARWLEQQLHLARAAASE